MARPFVPASGPRAWLALPAQEFGWLDVLSLLQRRSQLEYCSCRGVPWRCRRKTPPAT